MIIMRLNSFQKSTDTRISPAATQPKKRNNNERNQYSGAYVSNNSLQGTKAKAMNSPSGGPSLPNDCVAAVFHCATRLAFSVNF